MKKLLAFIVIGILLFGVSGCSCLQKVPSVTVGGKANKDNTWLGLDLSKQGFSATAPLVNVEVPFPTAKLKEDSKK
jgi:hypothetical protein